MRSKKKTDFEALVGRIQATSDALQQDALVVINRSVTTRAWLTGYYIVELESRFGKGSTVSSQLTGFDVDLVAIRAETWYDSLTAA